MFRSVVPAAKDFKEAVTLRKSIFEYKPKSKMTGAVVDVARELIDRLDARCGRAGEPPLADLVSGAPESERRAG